MTVTIPGENAVKDNNWKMIMNVLDIQPKDEVDGGGEKTFEQIASEVIAKGVK